MLTTICEIVTSIIEFFASFIKMIGPDMLFVIGLGVEVVLVLFFLIKSSFSYEASLNRALDKLNYWLFEKKMVTEENIRELNMIFKTKTPKRVCYYWQQYILFREGAPSSYLSTENLVEKPLKTSSYNSNIKNLTLFTSIWAFLMAMMVVAFNISENYLRSETLASAVLLAIFIGIIGLIFIVYLRARKNAVLNSLYQNVSLFGRFMDNACVDLPSYIDYQILFTPEEIEKGQPVLREFLDYKARKEKEEFNKAKTEKIDYEIYDFSATGVDGSIILDRAMKESDLFLKKKDKILVKVSQLEAELDSRRKNFDNTQKDYQTKIQASKENVNRLRQMQEETTNRIESNFYRKQQTQEIAKQEQYEQEFEQQRAKYLLEKNECEKEISELNKELEDKKLEVQNIMIGEYQTFFDKFCHSAEKVVGQVFTDKFDAMKKESEKDKQYITELEIKLKNVPQGEYDAELPQAEQNAQVEQAEVESTETVQEGQYDENGNYVYPNGAYYDPEGNYHDEYGNVYSQDGELISQAPVQEQTQEEQVQLSEPVASEGETAQPITEKKVVNFDDFDEFDYMTDISQKGAIYGVAENVINGVDENVEVVNNTEKTKFETVTPEAKAEEKVQESEAKKIVSDDFEEFALPEEKAETKSEEPKVEANVEEKPKKKAGRPRKIVTEPEKLVEKKKPGRPRKIVETPKTEAPAKRGRPKKIVVQEEKPVEKKKPGRPKKIVNKVEETEVKRGRGRPKKSDSITEINKKLSAEEAKLNKIRTNLNNELDKAMADLNSNNVDDKQAKRDDLIKQIDTLQKEAQNVIRQHESETRIAEINSKLEELLSEVKKLNS